MINSILTPELEANFELPKDDFKKFLMGLTEELAEEYNKRARQKAREEQKELERVALNKVMDVMENYFRLFSSNEEIVKVACKTSQKALMQISEMLRKAGDGKKSDEAGVGDGHHTPSILNASSISNISSILNTPFISNISSILPNTMPISPKANKPIDNKIKKSNLKPYTSLEALLDELNLN